MPQIKAGIEEDMIWHWASAEVDSDRFSQLYGSLSPRIKELITQSKRDQLTPRDWVDIKQIVKDSRSPLLKGLLRLGTTWFICYFQASEILQFKIMNWPPFAALAPTRKLVDFVAALDRGEAPPNDGFLSAYQTRRADFTMNAMRGCPIVISDRQEGPYILLEGYTRTSVITSKLQTKELNNSVIPIVLGICPRIAEWYLNDMPGSIKLG